MEKSECFHGLQNSTYGIKKKNPWFRYLPYWFSVFQLVFPHEIVKQNKMYTFSSPVKCKKLLYIPRFYLPVVNTLPYAFENQWWMKVKQILASEGILIVLTQADFNVSYKQCRLIFLLQCSFFSRPFTSLIALWMCFGGSFLDTLPALQFLTCSSAVAQTRRLEVQPHRRWGQREQWWPSSPPHLTEAFRDH